MKQIKGLNVFSYGDYVHSRKGKKKELSQRWQKEKRNVKQHMKHIIIYRRCVYPTTKRKKKIRLSLYKISSTNLWVTKHAFFERIKILLYFALCMYIYINLKILCFFERLSVVFGLVKKNWYLNRSATGATKNIGRILGGGGIGMQKKIIF